MRLRELREENNLSQWDVANGIQTGQRNIGRWEKEEVQPAADSIIKLADFFGVSTDYLLGRSDELGYVTVQSSPTVPALSADEQRLLNNFRAMRADLRPSLISMSDTLAKTPDEIAGNTQKKKA